MFFANLCTFICFISTFPSGLLFSCPKVLKYRLLSFAGSLREGGVREISGRFGALSKTAKSRKIKGFFGWVGGIFFRGGGELTSSPSKGRAGRLQPRPPSSHVCNIPWSTGYFVHLARSQSTFFSQPLMSYVWAMYNDAQVREGKMTEGTPLTTPINNRRQASASPPPTPPVAQQHLSQRHPHIQIPARPQSLEKHVFSWKKQTNFFWQKNCLHMIFFLQGNIELFFFGGGETRAAHIWHKMWIHNMWKFPNNILSVSCCCCCCCYFWNYENTKISFFAILKFRIFWFFPPSQTTSKKKLFLRKTNTGAKKVFKTVLFKTPSNACLP